MKSLLIPLTLIGAVAGVNAQAEMLNIAFNSPIASTATGYIDGQPNSAAFPAGVFIGQGMYGSFTINLDPTLQSISQGSDGERTLTFVNATSGQFSAGSYGPISFSIGEGTSYFDDAVFDFDKFYVGAYKKVIQGNFEYTYVFSLNLVGGFDSHPDPLTPPTPQDLAHYYVDSAGLSFTGSIVDISGTCTVNCTRNWQVTNGGTQPTLAYTLIEAVVPLPSSAWLFLSALGGPLFSNIQRRLKK